MLFSESVESRADKDNSFASNARIARMTPAFFERLAAGINPSVNKARDPLKGRGFSPSVTDTHTMGFSLWGHVYSVEQPSPAKVCKRIEEWRVAHSSLLLA